MSPGSARQNGAKHDGVKQDGVKYDSAEHDGAKYVARAIQPAGPLSKGSGGRGVSLCTHSRSAGPMTGLDRFQPLSVHILRALPFFTTPGPSLLHLICWHRRPVSQHLPTVAVERTPRLTSIRVLLAGMPRILVGIVKDIIISHEGIDVAGEIDGHRGLLEAAIRTQADVVVLREPAGSTSEIYRELLYGRPQLKILAITADGRRGFLHDLQPRVVALGEMSSTTLIDTIRDASGGTGAIP